MIPLPASDLLVFSATSFAHRVSLCVCESACTAELCLCGFVMNKPEDMFAIFGLQNTVPGGEEPEHEDIVSSL